MILTLYNAPLEELKKKSTQFSSADQIMMQLFDDLKLFLESFDYSWNHCVLSDPQQSTTNLPIQPSNHKSANRMAYMSKNDNP
jgi:hypothetical protein